MKTSSLLTAALAVLTVGWAGAAAMAQTPSAPLSGIHRLALQGNSDSVVSVPFARMESAEVTVSSFADNKITLRGTTGLAADQFVAGPSQPDSYYVLIATGAKAGNAYPITASDATTLTLSLEGDTLSGLAAGDRLAITPYWTLSTLFPSGQGVHATLSSTERRTEILLPDLNAPGINATPTRAFYLLEGHWYEVGGGTAIRDHEVIAPDTAFIIRHNIPTGTEWVAMGNVISAKLAMVVGIHGTRRQDNYFGLQRPNAVTLAESGLVQSGGFATSPKPGTRTDELLTFDNTVPGKNKSASAVYYHWNGAWRKVGAGMASFDATPVFKPGTGFIIRKAPMNTQPLWENTPGY